MTEKEKIWREGLPIRKSHLSTLQASRDRLLRETEGLETLLSTTLFFLPEEETPIRESISNLQRCISGLEWSISLLEESIRGEEEVR